ncbi:MAG: peptidylprolyl isomerase [Cytophagales bacterium]|nr:peptidylprolyl isomerase [Cytophagales bacterium]
MKLLKPIKLKFSVKHIFSIAILSIACTNISLAQVPRKVIVDKIIAKVDNQIILKSEYEVAYLQYLSSLKTHSATLSCDVLENLIINKFLMAKADIDSMVVDDKSVNDQLERRMQYFISQVGSEKKLEEYYNKTVAELKNELRDQVREQMVIQKMQGSITKNIKVTPGEVKQFFSAIPNDSLPFYSKEVEVGHIVKIPTAGKSQKNASRQKISELRDRIKKGESFEALAEKYSEDPVSARQGGELGFWKRGELVPEYEAAAFKLKPGEVSDVVESIFGYHIIQLIERRGLEYNSRHILIKPGSSNVDINVAKEYLDSLRLRILSDSISFTKAAKEYSDDKFTQQNGGMFSDEETGSTRVPIEKLDPAVFFIIDTMAVGSISNPIPYRTPDGKDGLRIIYYKSKVNPHKANILDDYQKIQNAALSEKKAKILGDWFQKHKTEVFITVDDEFKTCPILKNL